MHAPDRGLGPPRLWMVLLLVGLVHGGLAAARGVTLTPDSYAYAHWSRRLVETGFDFAAVHAEATASFPPILYGVFATLVALLRLPFGEQWPTALVALNLAASTGVALLLVRLAARVTGSAVAAWVALLLYAGCFEIAQWVPTALSDSTFMLLAFTIFAMAAARILGEARRWAPVLGLAAVAIFYRPTGMVLLPDLGFAAWLARRGRPLARPKRALAAFAVAVLAGSLLFAWLMQDPARWPFAALAPVFAFVAAGYKAGEVVHGRPSTFHAPPESLADHLLLSADRFLHFFAPVSSDFGLAHNAVALAFFLPCYALAAWLVVRLWRGETEFGAGERKVLVAAAAAVLAYALFHGLVQVDFDWRYRVPILPHLILLAAAGAAELRRVVAPRG